MEPSKQFFLHRKLEIRLLFFKLICLKEHWSDYAALDKENFL